MGRTPGRRGKADGLSGSKFRHDFVLAALSGRSLRQLSEEFGLSQSQCCRLRRKPWFERLAALLTKKAGRYAQAMLASLTVKALERTSKLIDDPDPKVALSAARLALEAARIVGTGAHVEVRIDDRDPGEQTVYQAEIVAGAFATRKLLERIGGGGNGHHPATNGNGSAHRLEAPAAPSGPGGGVE